MRFLLSTRKEETSKTLTDLFRRLKKLRQNCNFKEHTAKECREKAVRDTFIWRTASPTICQRLIRNKTLNLQSVYDQASALDLAQKNNKAYVVPIPSPAVIVCESNLSDKGDKSSTLNPPETSMLAVNYNPRSANNSHSNRKDWFFCGATLYHKRIV